MNSVVPVENSADLINPPKIYEYVTTSNYTYVNVNEKPSKKTTSENSA